MVQLVGTTSLGLGKLIDGKNQFVHIRYSAHSNGSNMTTEIQADTKYIGIATNSSETAPTSPSDYSWGRFVGTPGTSSYTWIRYSSNADGSNMTAIPSEETKYIGVAITSEDSAPTDYTKYSWALFKGSDGRGVKKTEVSYQKSTSGTVIPTGSWLASIPSLNEGEYLWTRTLFTYTDETTTSTYNVSRNGTSGLGIARTDVHYQKSTSGTVAPTGTWTVTIPTVRANEYLWTRTTITYTDDSTSVSYSVGKMGADGKDAQLLYLTASSQIQAFDKDNQPKTTQPITISAKLQNASGTATFVAIPYVGNTAQTPITLGGTGNDRTLLPSQWTDPKWTIIAITATLGSLTDTISVNKVKDGESGETPVVHIAWADSADGSEGFTLELPTNKIPKYRGYYVDYSTIASTDPKKYKWERNPDDTGAEVDKAMTAVESAVANAEEAERLAATASQTATIAKQEASAAQNAASMAQGEVSRIEGVIVGVQGDIGTALQWVADQAVDLQATKETLELNYAKKTEVSDVQAALTTEISKKVGELQTTVSQTYAAKNDVVAMEGRLQSQITQTAGEVSSVVGKVDKLEADTTEAQKKVDEALEKSAAAQTAASQAQVYADAADRKVTAAQTDLNEAKQNLVNTINRVDATEADIAEAQLKVEAAQAAVAQAQRDAAEAALAASNAQAAADKAQQDVAALTKRVVSAETAITQNSEQIRLAATKTEEIGTKLENLKVGGENLFLDAAFRNKFLNVSASTSYVPGRWIQYNNHSSYKFGEYNGQTNYLQFTSVSKVNLGIIQFLDSGVLQPGKEYCVRLFTMCEKSDYVITININKKSSNGSINWYYSNIFTKTVKASSNYSEISAKFTIPAEDDGVMYGISIFNYGTDTSNGQTIKLVKPKLEEGNTYTDFSISTKDMAMQDDLTNNYYSKTQTDAAIKVAADNVTTTVRRETTEQITNINICGENLIKNTNTDKMNITWTMQTGEYERTYYKDNGVIVTKLKRDSVQQTGWSVICVNDIVLDKLKPNTKYIISFEIAPTTATSLQFVLRRGNGAGVASNMYSMNYSVPANQWSKITFMLTTTNPLPELLDQVIYITGMNSAPGVEYHFRNFKMAEGNKETPWSPAPEDMATLTQYTEVKQLADRISSTVYDSASGLVTKTTQLAGKYAIQNLNSYGEVLSSLNMNGGNVRIKGGLIDLDGNVRIQDAFVTNLKANSILANEITAKATTIVNAKIANLDAGVITTGILKGANLSLNLGTGEVQFKKGRIQAPNNTLDIQVNTGIMKVLNTNGEGVTFQNGNLYFGNKYEEGYYGQITYNDRWILSYGYRAVTLEGAQGFQLRSANYSDGPLYWGTVKGGGISYIEGKGMAIQSKETVAIMCGDGGLDGSLSMPASINLGVKSAYETNGSGKGNGVGIYAPKDGIHLKAGNGGKITFQGNIDIDYSSKVTGPIIYNPDTSISQMRFVGSYSTSPYVEVVDELTGIAYGITAWKSDERLKTNISDQHTTAFNVIDKLKVKQFNWKQNGNHVDYGLIAQEVEKILPNAVLNVEQIDEMDIKQLETQAFIPLLIKAVQELKEELNTLKGA